MLQVMTNNYAIEYEIHKITLKSTRILVIRCYTSMCDSSKYCFNYILRCNE